MKFEQQAQIEIIQHNQQTFEESPVDDCNVFVKYLPCDYTEKELYKLFEPYGSIVNTKVMVNIKTGNSLGYGFVRFSEANFAQEAIKNMNRVQIGYKTLLCKLSKPSTTVNLVTSESAQSSDIVENPGEPTLTLYVRILSPTITDLMLKQTFSQYGEVIESQVLIDSISGKSKRAGLIRFSNIQNSINAYQSMIGSVVLGETPLVIKYAPNSTKLNKPTSPQLQSQQQSSASASPILQSQYIQPYLLNATSAQQSHHATPSSFSLSSSTSSTSSQFHHHHLICTQPTPSTGAGSSQQQQQQQQYIYPEYQYHYSDQYNNYYGAPFLTTTTTATGETIIISSTIPQTSHHTYYHPDAYYYSTTPVYPIYNNTNGGGSVNNSPPSSPQLSPQLSPKHSYYDSSNNYQQQQQQQQQNSILICTFKGHLEYSNLLSIFSKYGELKSINININPNNNKTKCFISFNHFESAISAQQQLDKCKIGQNLIRVKFFSKKI